MYKRESQKSVDDVVASHKGELKNAYSLDVDNENECLPHIYWLPKMHKNPIKERIIIAAPKCSVKPLTKNITPVFKLLYNQIEKYDKVKAFYSGVKKFWCIQNTVPVKKAVEKLSARNCAKSITTFDFSTLYTNIPHDKLIFVLDKLIDFCFQGASINTVSYTHLTLPTSDLV